MNILSCRWYLILGITIFDHCIRTYYCVVQCSHVSQKITFNIESFIAHATLVRSFSGVCSTMYQHTGMWRERFCTSRTHFPTVHDPRPWSLSTRQYACPSTGQTVCNGQLFFRVRALNMSYPISRGLILLLAKFTAQGWQLTAVIFVLFKNNYN